MLTGFKTLLAAILITVVGALQGMNWEQLLPNDPQLVGWVTAGIGVVMMVLRMVTTTPVGVAASDAQAQKP